MKIKLIHITQFAALLLLGCANNTYAGESYNPMRDPQIKVLQQQGLQSSMMIFGNQGCKAKGYAESFTIAGKLKNISNRYVSVMSQHGKYSDAEISMATEALVDSSFAQINLLQDIAKKAENMNCKSNERKAYNEIIASPVYSTGIASVFSQDLMIARSKVSQLGSR